MEETVNSQAEAMNWFLSHATGSVKCVAVNGREKTVDSMMKAAKFFEENGEGLRHTVWD